jgi:hypothetical protein
MLGYQNREQWREIKDLQSRLTEAEQTIAELIAHDLPRSDLSIPRVK